MCIEHKQAIDELVTFCYTLPVAFAHAVTYPNLYFYAIQ
jgi:hypothetical protein